MRKFITLFCIIALLLLLVGCSGGRERDSSEVEWRRGSQGIEMNFLTGSPPRVVYDDDPIELAVEIWNRGAAPVSGDLYFTGFDESIFSGISKRPQPFSISESKTKYNDEGGYEMVRQSGRIFLPIDVDVFRDTRIGVDACYHYETIADIAVCVDPEPNKRDFSSDTCRPSDVSGGTQAAPVAVTNVQVEPTPQKTIFRITIENVGAGTVLDQTVVNDCLDPDVTFQLTDWVDVEEVRLGLDDYLQCETPNPVRMINGRARITCIADNIRGSSAYATTLQVFLTYGYRESIQTPVEIRSII